MPSLRLPDVLRRYTGGEACFEVGGGTVGEALADAFGTYPELRIRLVDEAGRLHSYLVAFLNETELGRNGLQEAALAPGDTLTIIEAIGGG